MQEENRLLPVPVTRQSWEAEKLVCMDREIRKEWFLELLDTLALMRDKAVTGGEYDLLIHIADTMIENVEFE